MNHYELIRSYLPDRTVSELVDKEDGESVCNVLERPWVKNKAYKSCIPEGLFTVVPDDTGKHRFYRVQGVSGRSAIELHVAYSVDELEGCLAPCFGFNSQYNPLDPEEALNHFVSYQGRKPFLLTIRARTYLDGTFKNCFL